MKLDRRSFVKLLASAAVVSAPGCTDSSRYTEQDVERLEAQRREERERSGTGPYGPQVYRGYRGLAELPWFELDDRGRLRCVAEDLPPIIDIHAHLGMSMFLAPDLDLHARTDRVRHLLDCDGEMPGCPLDLDVYINANFRPQDLSNLRWQVVAQTLWGSEAAATHTIPNLVGEMDACRVSQTLVLPIAFDLPFGGDMTGRWMEAIAQEGAGDRLLLAASVHPGDPEGVEKLRGYAARGARVVKLHPTAQRFFPDAPETYPIYEECSRLGLPVLFHGGRAGIEPSYTHQFAVMRHYEGAFRDFPGVQFVLGHSGARDVGDAIPLARQYSNVWMDVHGQGVTVLNQLIEQVGPDRLLYGTDWPFYHLAATLAKVLLVTRDRTDIRDAILRGNALRLLGLASDTL